MKKVFCASLIICSLFVIAQNKSYAQYSIMNDVYLFQSFFRDTPVTPKGYAEGLFIMQIPIFFDVMQAGGQEGFEVTPELELTTGFIT